MPEIEKRIGAAFAKLYDLSEEEFKQFLSGEISLDKNAIVGPETKPADMPTSGNIRYPVQR